MNKPTLIVVVAGLLSGGCTPAEPTLYDLLWELEPARQEYLAQTQSDNVLSCPIGNIESPPTLANGTGTWTMNNNVTNSSDPSQVGQASVLNITYSDQDTTACVGPEGPGETCHSVLQQVNAAGVSTGSGVAYVLGGTYAAGTGPLRTDASYTFIEFIQSNTAEGNGCTQEAVNALSFYQIEGLTTPPGEPPWVGCVLTVVTESTCGGIGWKVSQGYAAH